ncbi:hypothetical protein GXB81_05520 [Paraburkholderia sp. Ac-20336]|uniref:major capsid protein n=1 Tax=unclassified Paraburkholderia TaxID=2615204 RepID=UPI00141EF436|nr:MULTISPECIES: major capsid protein [unclassified Paraburkholderia]MBN3802515.1 hypothetical protein [Paraburkholderia sp. Ac-20336]NIF80967.1 hypothetical protein [Paraburkholderia sp. Cy-641]
MFAMLKGVKRAAVGAAVAVASAGAFAQTSDASTFDPTAIVASINNVAPALVTVGGAVLGVVAVAWGIKMVRTFLGR